MRLCIIIIIDSIHEKSNGFDSVDGFDFLVCLEIWVVIIYLFIFCGEGEFCIELNFKKIIIIMIKI